MIVLTGLDERLVSSIKRSDSLKMKCLMGLVS